MDKKMNDVKWYENLTYKESTEIILEKMENMKRDFVAIGYYLKHVRDSALFLEDGYHDIWEYAEEKIGIKRTTASRWMSINDMFSENGNTPILAKEYRAFNKSQLQEMLYLNDEQMQDVKPDMTVKEIREIRKPTEEPEVIPGKMRIPEDYPETCPEEMCDVAQEISEEDADQGMVVVALKKPDETEEQYLNDAAKKLIICWHVWFLQDFANRVLNVEKSPAEIKAHLAGASRDYHFETKNGVAHINLFDDYVQLWDINCNCMGDYEWFYFAAAIQRMWNVVAMESAQSSARKGIDDKHQEESAVQEAIVDQEEAEKEEQPELPTLKNNEKRKEWLNNYRDWGLWYYDDHIDVNYYKYDFPDGSRLIVAEYPEREQYWTDKKETERHFHLLEKHKKKYSGRYYDEVYRHETDSETRMVEFLKEIQKGK